MTDNYELNQRVSLNQFVNRKGKVINVLKPYGGYNYYEIQWDDGSLEVKASHELLPEVQITNSWDLLENNTLRDYRDFSIATTIHKVKNTTSNTISSLKASRTIFTPYQYKPLVKFLNSDNKRILIADEVGLGKTIEAGHILLEMAARGNVNNALVICSNSIREKWKTELQDKFNFTFKIYQTAADFVEDIRNDIAASKKSIFGIINYEKCRNKKIKKIIEEKNYRFDLIICDEVHKIRNSSTKQHKSVAGIVDESDAVVFMTATPIMTDIRNLHSLIKLLDKERYETFDIFNNAVNQNKPFIRALNSLNNKIPLPLVAESLENSMVLKEMTADDIVFHTEKLTIGSIYKNDELYLRAINRMKSGKESPINKVQIQQDLIELNSLNYIYTRTRKRDVMAQNVVQREPKTISVTLSDEELEVYNSVINEYDDENSLGLIQRKRQMSSCITAFRTNRDELLAGYYDNNILDSKFSAFKTIVSEIVIQKKKKVIVFAFFTNTLLYLKCKLKEMGIGLEIIYGGITDRNERIENFRDDNKISVLLSSEVGSEGLDLQFCDAIVNYDLPWNPMVVEQRIGRIDRIGQRSSIINIYNLIIKDTIEELIYEKLYNRINLFRESIGDLEDILGEEEPLTKIITNGIENLYKTKLNDNERKEELERLAQAIENNKQTLENIKSQLSEAFSNDLHFQNEIELIEKNRRYLTKEEIIKYIESAIRLKLTTLHLEHKSNDISIIEIPASDTNLLFDFIEKYKDAPAINSELETLYRRFKINKGKRQIEITFSQEYAYQHKNVEYISAFHPLINAITNYFISIGLDKNTTHKIKIDSTWQEMDKKINAGFYILIVFKITITKNRGDGRENQYHYMKSILSDINHDQPQIMDSAIADYIYGYAQMKCSQFTTDISINKEFVELIRPDITMKMKTTELEVKEDEEVKFWSSIKRRTQQELDYLSVKINRLQEQLVEGNVPEPIWRKNIDDAIQRKSELMEYEKNAYVSVNHNLISINIVEIS